MQILIETPPDSFVCRLDTRTRLVAVGVLAVGILGCEEWRSLACGALGAAALLLWSGAVRITGIRRLIALNLFLLGLVVLMPLSTPGTAVFRFGAASWTHEGIVAACRVILKANAVMWVSWALLTAVDPTLFGVAATRLGVPAKFAHILLFMVRYVENVHAEYHRLRNAMRIRGFRPRCDLHSLRSVGYLIGMLLVRGLDRAERVMDAMRCRGYQGRLYMLREQRIGGVDVVFLCGVAATVACLVLLEIS